MDTPGHIFPGRVLRVEGDGRLGPGAGVDLPDLVVHPDVSHGGHVLGQGPCLVTQNHRGGTQCLHRFKVLDDAVARVKPETE